MFKKQYFSIIFWKSLVYIMGVFSLLIITPQLTSQPKIFGIYTFCASIVIFFSYADLGFIAATRKFAAEYIIKKQLRSEIAITAFSSLIFLSLSLPIAIAIFYFSLYPEIIIADLINEEERKIASSLLLILACFFPVLILQRVIQIIYSVRLEDYHVFKFEIISIFLKIISIFYFFSNGNYQIVEYFLFCNVLNLINLLVLGFLASKRYNYDFIFFVKSLRYRKSIYDKVAKLAYNSLFVSLMWLLFYEIDILIITSLSGALAAAHYAIAFNIINILRNILGTIYYPFTVKFNHLFISNKEKLKEMLYTILKIGSYIIIPGLTVIALYSKPLIISWVGNDFISSVLILQLLVISYFFYPISTPIGAILITKLEMKILYINSFIIVMVQYLGLWVFYKSGDVSLVLASLKIIGAGFASILLIKYVIQYLRISILSFVTKVLLLPILLSLIFTIISLKFIDNFEYSLGLGSLFIAVLCVIISYLFIVGLLFLLDKSFRTDLYRIIKS